MKSSIHGKTVLVTRPKAQAEELTVLLEQAGAKAVHIPLIRIAPTSSWDACDRALETIGEYNGVICTSSNAADFFFSRAKNTNPAVWNQLTRMSIYVVGEKTGQSVRAYNLQPEEFTGTHNARGLAELLSNRGVEGKRFLFPRGNIAKDDLSGVLRAHNAVVDEVVVYDTLPPLQQDADALKKRFRDNTVDIVTLFSPSSVRNFLDILTRSLITRQCIAVIGDSTANAARNLALPVHVVADQPTSSALVSAIIRYYE